MPASVITYTVAGNFVESPATYVTAMVDDVPSQATCVTDFAAYVIAVLHPVGPEDSFHFPISRFAGCPPHASVIAISRTAITLTIFFTVVFLADIDCRNDSCSGEDPSTWSFMLGRVAQVYAPGHIPVRTIFRTADALSSIQR